MRYVDNKLNCKDIFEDIIKNWNLEAKQEDDKYFYYVDEVNAIENGSKCYVIGRGWEKLLFLNIYPKKNDIIFLVKK